MRATTFDEKDVREDVRLSLPDVVAAKVIYVTSGDSGKEYHIQVFWQKTGGPPWDNPTIWTICDCPDGYWHVGPTIYRTNDRKNPGCCCKHAEWVLAYLKEKSK